MLLPSLPTLLPLLLLPSFSLSSALAPTQAPLVFPHLPGGSKSAVPTSTFVPIDPTSPSSQTLIDVLSSDPDYALLLRMVQRARMVPALNRLREATVWAPTDEAIRRRVREHEEEGAGAGTSAWARAVRWVESEEVDLEGGGRDNVQQATRQLLFYHMLNYTLPAAHGLAPSSSSPNVPTLPQSTLHTTLLFPDSGHLPPNPHKPPHSPWLPECGDGILLSGEGQRIRVAREPGDDGALRVGINERGEGGAKVVKKERRARNGVVLGIDQVLEPPADLATQIRTHPSLSTLASLLPPPVLDNLTDVSPHLTLFLPTNEAFDSLDPLILSYLRNVHAAPDLISLLGGHASGQNRIGWSDRWRDGDEFPTLYNTTLKLTSSDTLTLENDKHDVSARLASRDILASNGVLHTVSSLLTPPRLLALNVEKHLIGLNATRFVDMFRSVNLTRSYLSDSDAEAGERDGYTILAPRDDVVEVRARRREHGLARLPEPGTEGLKDLLKYHVVKGRVKKNGVHEDGELVETELRTPLLKGQGQRLQVSRAKGRGGKEKENKHDGWSFGDATVVGEPVHVGNSTIYIISSVLDPPRDFLSVAVSDLRLSIYVASLYAADLAKPLSHTPGTTVLVPRNKAFNALGLAMQYLLLPDATDELASVVRYHALDSIVYLSDFANASYPTLDPEHGSLDVERKTNSTSLVVRSPRTPEGYAVNGEDRPARVLSGDVLTASGTIHVIDQVELPPGLDITIGKLVRGAHAETMADLVERAGMGWLLDGLPPPTDADARRTGLESRSDAGAPPRSYTLLCPTDIAFTNINLTHYLTSPAALDALIRLHILPSPSIPSPPSSRKRGTKGAADGHPLALADAATYSTLLSKREGGPSSYGDLSFRATGDGSWLVGIKGARGTDRRDDWARVIAFGRATPRWRLEANATLAAAGNGDEGFDSDGSGRKGRRGNDKNKPPGAEAAMVLGGGVITIDSVLVPYEPSWLFRWGWAVFVALGVTVALVGIGYGGWQFWARRKAKREGYERVEAGEED